jgi:hypothetical protein
MITINDAFRKFLNEQEASLKSETFLDCEDVILLYEEFLEFSAEDYLSDEDRDLYTGRHEKDHQNYCDIFGPEHLTPSGIKDFLEDYVVEVGGGKKFVGTSAKVLHNFFEWARKEGSIEEKAFEANNEVIGKYKKRY